MVTPQGQSSQDTENEQRGKTGTQPCHQGRPVIGLGSLVRLLQDADVILLIVHLWFL
jgi:hypothetical protein